jgi:hypothetical protein
LENDMTTATKTVKVVNYTPEQTANMVDAYVKGSTVADIAAMVGKSVRSVTAKLSRELKGTEHEYKAKTYKTKSGGEVVSKEDLADKLTVLASLTEAEADSLTKANKTALAKIVALLSAADPDAE